MLAASVRYGILLISTYLDPLPAMQESSERERERERETRTVEYYREG